MKIIGRLSILILSALCCAPCLFIAVPRAGGQVSIEMPPSADSDAPITGKPYEADKIMHTRRVLADGTVTTRDVQIHEARDSQGRVLVELDTSLQPHPEGPAISFVIVTVRDPAAGTELLWNNLHHLATRTHILSARVRELRAEVSGKPQPVPAKPEILGQRVISGRMATGRFIEKPIPAGLMGNATATVDKREWWTDEDLHLVVLSTSSNPQHGEQTTDLQDLKLVEPDPSRFHPPDGYTITDVGPPHSIPSVRLGTLTLPPPPLDLANAPPLSHADAMIKLTSGNTLDKSVGAAVLVKEAQGSSNISLKAATAYSLARYNTGLTEASQLADEALHSIETTTSIEVPGKASPADFAREITLSRYWNTVGFIAFRQGHNEPAKLYMESAWRFDPRGYFGLHLGRLDESSGDTAAAIRIYREALLASGSDNEKQTLRDRIAALSPDPNPPPIETAQTTLNNVHPQAAGTAFFDLIYSATHSSPEVFFVSGSDALKPLAPAIAPTIAKSEGNSFTLPDEGPEIVARRIELTCKDTSAASCQIQFLTAQQASQILLK